MSRETNSQTRTGTGKKHFPFSATSKYLIADHEEDSQPYWLIPSVLSVMIVHKYIHLIHCNSQCGVFVLLYCTVVRFEYYSTRVVSAEFKLLSMHPLGENCQKI